MQALDEFKVQNYTKSVLDDIQKKQHDQIYAFQMSSQHWSNTEKTHTTSTRDSILKAPFEDEIIEAEEIKEEEVCPSEESKQKIAPVPDNLLNFEDEVERVIQSFLEAEH